jgi:hypothetical protein
MSYTYEELEKYPPTVLRNIYAKIGLDLFYKETSKGGKRFSPQLLSMYLRAQDSGFHEKNSLKPNPDSESISDCHLSFLFSGVQYPPREFNARAEICR